MVHQLNQDKKKNKKKNKKENQYVVCNILMLFFFLAQLFFYQLCSCFGFVLLLTDIMERKERVFGLKYCMGVSIGPHLTAEQEREQEREQEEAVVVVVRAVAEMVCFGLCYLRGGRLKVIIMNGYVSEYSNGYCNGFNFCLGAELTATTARARAPAETKFDIILLDVDLNLVQEYQ